MCSLPFSAQEEEIADYVDAESEAEEIYIRLSSRDMMRVLERRSDFSKKKLMQLFKQQQQPPEYVVVQSD